MGSGGGRSMAEGVRGTFDDSDEFVGFVLASPGTPWVRQFFGRVWCADSSVVESSQ